MTGHVYLTCGLRIRSEIELHLPQAEGADADVDVDVRWGDDIGDADDEPPGELVARDEAHGVGWYTVTDTGSDHRLRFRGCAEFVVAADTVTVRRVPDGRTELIPVLLAGTVTALLLTLRGATVLHASAVATSGRALALVGHSGRGKSTLAALLCGAGADLVTDDVLVVEPSEPPSCIGGASELRLRAAASEGFDLPDGASRRTADERTAWDTGHHAIGAQELGAIVFPFPSRAIDTIELRRLPPDEALLGMLSCPRINGWRRASEIGRDFGVLGQLSNTVPVFAAIVPWGPPFDPAIVGELLGLVG